MSKKFFILLWKYVTHTKQLYRKKQCISIKLTSAPNKYTYLYAAGGCFCCCSLKCSQILCFFVFFFFFFTSFSQFFFCVFYIFILSAICPFYFVYMIIVKIPIKLFFFEPNWMFCKNDVDFVVVTYWINRKYKSYIENILYRY